MIEISRFEKEWKTLKMECESGSFSYSDSSVQFTTIINSHFNNVRRHDKYGVYVVRQQKTHDVMYIGKGGTVKSDGNFKGQDIPKRLKNVKEKDMPANQWFRILLDEKGPLLIEYIFTTVIPIAPAFVEAFLLQAYLNEHGHLPFRNKAF